ncbi:hypothetical protein JM16_003114 [Phytophthora kernoviae]|uniref:Jacalin-type lectin domain-containing protein n=1 Tax=Phytophthora kernoviae TaxID=325452 RepID=A0A8T0M3U7_9STRA|nr:hypothetical protein JM16_003114 [Phytophthora kernoviae]
MAVFQVLLLLTIAVVHGSTSVDEDIKLSEAFGGSGGIAFSDINSIEFEQTLNFITISADDRVNGVAFQVATPAELTLSHGGAGGTDYTLTLESGEYITSMEIHWDRRRLNKRVFYLKFGTNRNNFISGGTTTEDSTIVAAPKGFQFGGFFGRCYEEIDQLGVIWMRKKATTLALTDDIKSSWFSSGIRNWVGPTIGDASDTACYRKTEPFGSKDLCPLGYTKQRTNCIAQCPLSYPVECGAECIPQNDDCILEILSKVVAVVNAAINTATVGVFGAIFSAYKNTKQTYFCAVSIISLLRSLVFFVRFQQTTAPQGNVEELLAVAYQTDVVMFDLPIAVYSCLGMKVPPTMIFADVVVNIVETIVKQTILNGEEIVSSAKNVIALLTNASVVNGTDDKIVDELQDLMDSNSTCGYDLKRLTDRVILSVNNIRNMTPGVAITDLRVAISNSSLVLNVIPAVTNKCMDELLPHKTLETAFQTRDLIRKTFGVIIDQLIETSTTDLGESVSEKDYMLKVSNLGLVALTGLDPTGIAGMMAQFVQPTCGPTAFIGEIDDGTLYDALGLTTVDEAFTGSYGRWTKEGDGIVNLIFESTDTKDVKVVIHSGGDTIEKVEVVDRWYFGCRDRLAVVI